MKYTNVYGISKYLAPPSLKPKIKIYKSIYLAFSLLLIHAFVFGQCPIVDNTVCEDEIISGAPITTFDINCDGEAFDVCAGGLYKINLPASNSYLFSLVAVSSNSSCSNPTLQSGVIKLFDDQLQTNLLATSNGVTPNTSMTPSNMEFVNGVDTEFFLSVFSHSCSLDWSSYILTVTCDNNPCEISSPTTHPISANEAGCLSGPSAFSVSSSGLCEAPTAYTIVSHGGTNATVDSDGVVTIPEGLSFGSYDIVIGTNDCGGSPKTTSTKVAVAPVFGCEAKNVSLYNSCQADISSLVLNGVCADKNQFTIFIDNIETSIITEIGVHNYEVFYTPNANTSVPLCWNTIKAEDKIGPGCQLSETEYNFVCGFESEVATPVYTDCSDVATPNPVQEFTYGTCGQIADISNENNDLFDDFILDENGENGQIVVDGMVIPQPTNASAFTDPPLDGLPSPFVLDRIIKKVYSANDADGTMGETCEQFIYIWRPRNILEPVNATLECGTDTDVATLTGIDPQYVPHFQNPNFDAPAAATMFRLDLEAAFSATRIDADGDPEYVAVNHESCGYITRHEDIFNVDSCGLTVRIDRKWYVSDCCTENASVTTSFQRIRTVDTTPPVLNGCPTGMEIGSVDNPREVPITKPDVNNPLATDCLAQVDLSDFMLSATDICSPQGFSFRAEYFLLGSDLTGSGTSVSTQNNPFLPKGNYRVSVTAADDCDNKSAPCDYFVNVIDEVNPNINCTSDLIVGISDGTGKVCADHATAWKTCGTIALLEVKVVGNDDNTFATCISIGCDDDLDGDLLVPLMYRATDDCGNTSTITCDAILQINIVPAFDNCPTDVSFQCEADIDSTEPTISAVACEGNYVVGFTDERSFDVSNCAGSITRTFTASLNGVVVATSNNCVQVLTISDTEAPTFDANTVQDMRVSCDNIPAAAVLSAMDNCAGAITNIMARETPAEAPSPACADYDIVRTWIAEDNCGNSVVQTQSITVIYRALVIGDITPAVISGLQNCDDFNDDSIFTAPTVDYPCPDAIGLTISAPSFSSTLIDPMTGMRTRTANYTVSDGCGFSEDISTTATFENCCPVLNIDIDDFENTCDAGVGTITVNVSTELNSTDVVYSLYDITNIDFTNPESVANDGVFIVEQPGDNVFDVSQAPIFPRTYRIEVFELGNEPMEGCPITFEIFAFGCSRSNIAGRVFNEEFVSIEEVEVELMNTEIPMSMTDIDGEYVFEDLDQAEYTVTAHKENDPTNGISTFDLVAMVQHVLGINELSTPYKLIAADVNMDQSIDIHDMLELRELILYAIDDFTVNDSWRFIDADYVFPDPQNPWIEAIPSARTMVVGEDVSKVDFIAVKIGDLDCSAQTKSNLNTIEDRSSATLVLNVKDQSVKAGSVFELALTPSADVNLSAAQFTIDFDPSLARFNGIDSETLDLGNNTVNTKFAKEGLVPFAWYTHAEQALTTSSEIILTFTAKQDLTIAELFQIDSELTPAVAYNSEGKQYDVRLNIQEANSLINNQSVVLHQNQPNPFLTNTTIGFEVSSAQPVSFTVFDIDGKMLYTRDIEANNGYNNIEITSDEIAQRGVMFYQLNTADYSVTKKMIILE